MSKFWIPVILMVSTLIISGAGCGDDSSSGQSNAQPDAATYQDAAQTQDGGQQGDAASAQDAGQQGDAALARDAAQGSDAGQDIDGGTESDPLGFGSACECQGTDCEQAGVPVPNGGNNGTIVGCDHVDQPWTGADLVCLRTYTGATANKTYFANGYCGLMATHCTGNRLICNTAEFGDYDAMTTCPAGTVMIQDSQTVSAMGLNATIDSKTCVKSCSGGSNECREGEIDPDDNNQPTQYQCIDKNGVQFCYDPRDLSDSYQATQF